MPVVNDFTALLFDNPAFRFNGSRDAATAVIVTYSFDDRAAELPSEAEYPTKTIGDFTTGFAAPGQQTAVRDALAVFEAAAGIRFVEVETDGMIQFVDATSIFSGASVVSFADVPSVNASFGSMGHVVMNQAHFPIGQGNAGYRILMHEIGHAVGLDHSDEGTNTLNPALATVTNTIMPSVGSGQIVSDIGIFDKQALQFLYGGVTDFNLDQLTVTSDAPNAEIDITGTAGADHFLAPNFDSNIDAGDGADSIFGNEQADEIDGEGGDDILTGGAGDDILRGGPGEDMLDGLGFIGGGNFTGGADQLFGGDDDDMLVLRFDTAVYDGGGGVDTVDGSLSTQVLVEFTDTVKFVSIERAILSPGGDFFRAGAADAEAYGAAGDDTLLGGVGNDMLDGQEGADDMRGGAGDDVYGVDDAGDSIIDTSGTDTVNASIAYTLPSAIENGLALTTNLLQGNSGANGLGGNGVANTLSGLGGDDSLVGRGGDDTLLGGDGFDRLNGGAGADFMAGGDDNDIYTVDDAGDQVVEMANEGVDRINAFVDFVNPDNVEFLVGLFSNVGLTLTGNSGRDRITGANRINSPDVLSGEDNNDKIVALVGNDTIFGGGGNDRIFGNSGNDVITGGTGNDRLTGQFGSDRFVHAPGDNNDRITDFDVMEDLLDLTAHGFVDEAAVLALTTDTPGGALINFAGPHSVLLEGVAKAAIGAEDILV